MLANKKKSDAKQYIYTKKNDLNIFFNSIANKNFVSIFTETLSKNKREKIHRRKLFVHSLLHILLVVTENQSWHFPVNWLLCKLNTSNLLTPNKLE